VVRASRCGTVSRGDFDDPFAVQIAFSRPDGSASAAAGDDADAVAALRRARRLRMAMRSRRPMVFVSNRRAPAATTAYSPESPILMLS